MTSDEDEPTDPGIVNLTDDTAGLDPVKTKRWLRLKQMISMLLLADDSSDIPDLIKFVAQEWPGHAPRSREFATLMSVVTKLRREIEELKRVINIPTRRRSIQMRHTHIVIISREQETIVTPFNDIQSAHEFYDKWSPNWSDSYLTEVLRGPKT